MIQFVKNTYAKTENTLGTLSENVFQSQVGGLLAGHAIVASGVLITANPLAFALASVTAKVASNIFNLLPQSGNSFLQGSREILKISTLIGVGVVSYAFITTITSSQLLAANATVAAVSVIFPPVYAKVKQVVNSFFTKDVNEDVRPNSSFLSRIFCCSTTKKSAIEEEIVEVAVKKKREIIENDDI